MRVYKHGHKMIRIIYYYYYNVTRVMLARVNVYVPTCKTVSVEGAPKTMDECLGGSGEVVILFQNNIILRRDASTVISLFLSHSLSLSLSLFRFISCIRFLNFIPTPPRTIELCPIHIIIR